MENEARVSISALETLADTIFQDMVVLCNIFSTLDANLTNLGGTFTDAGYEKLRSYVSTSKKNLDDSLDDAATIVAKLKHDADTLRRMAGIL